MIPTVKFEEYRDKYKEHFTLERSSSGVMVAKWHTNGGSLVWDQPIHRAIHQLTTDVGQDVETEENKKWLSYEHMFYDGTNICEGIVNDLEIPTMQC